MNMMSNKEIGVGNLLASGLTLKQHRDLQRNNFYSSPK